MFQTTTSPSSGLPTTGNLSSTSYVGNYFTLTAPAHIDTISVAASVSDGGSIFAAILSVPSLGSLPTGTPFGSSGTSAPLVTAVLHPGSTNGIVSSSVSVDLPAGNYVLVFGTGQYGATSGVGNLSFSDGTKASLPAGSNQINYGQSCNGGSTFCWSSLFGAPSPYYFALSGTSGASGITSLSPTFTTPGGQAFTLTVNGTNFQQGSTVSWNGTPLATTYLNSTQLTTTVPSSLTANTGTAAITVSTNNVVTSAVNFVIGTSSGGPVISGLSPASILPGSGGFTLVVTGSNFLSGSIVEWNGNFLLTNHDSNTQLSASVPAAYLTSANNATITVLGPSPSNLTSNSMTFVVGAAPASSISALSPSSSTPGGSSFLLTVTGTGFVSGSTVLWNGSPLVTTYNSPTQLQASVSSTLLANAGTANVSVSTAGVATNQLQFTIAASNTPVLSSVSPTSAIVGSGQFTLTVNGSNFANGATVTWNGGLLSTTYLGTTQLSAIVPASLVAGATTASIGVINPTGSSPNSNTLNFPVVNTNSPTISSVTPATASAGGAQFTVTVNGQGFLNGATVRWNGSALSTTYVSSSQLTAVVPASLITSVGTSTITVANSGGAISNSLVFSITSTTTSMTIFQTTQPPTPGQPAAASLSINQFLGNYFVITTPTHIDSISTYAQASDGGTIFGAIISVPSLTSPPTGNPFDGSTLATATLRPGTTSGIVTAPISVDLQPGTYAIVFGSGLFGASSTTALAAYSNGASANVPAGWNQVSWGLYCGGGLNTCWSANFSSPSQFYFALTGTTSTTGGLSITSLNPSAVTAGSQQFTLTINGTGFTTGSIAQWNGQALATQVSSPTLLTATVPANLVTTIGTASVTVLNPGGTISGSSAFTISSPTFSITSVSPTTTTAGGQAFVLTVNGSGFANGSTLQWDGSPLTTTFVNSTQLTANVPATLITSAGTHSLTVLNPSGTFTNFFNFTVSSSTATISSLTPNTMTVGSGPFTLLVNGSGFLNTSIVSFNGTQLATNYVNGTQLSVTVPSNLVAGVGTFNVTVQNTTGGTASSPASFTVSPVGGGSTSAAIAHFAVGSNFTTGIFVVNTASISASYSIQFYDDNGNPISLPFSSGSTSRLSGTLPPFGSLYIEATNPSGPLTSGWGQITADSSITIQTLFRSTLNNTHYEAAVETSTGSHAFEIPFDETNFAPNTPLYTGLAIANLDSANSAQVSCIARDPFGNVLSNSVTIPLIRPLGHYANTFPGLVNQKGTLQCNSTTNVAVIALRFIGTDTFSSLPVIKQ